MSWLRLVLGGTWRAVARHPRGALVFLAAAMLAVALWFAWRGPGIPSKAVLHLDLDGALVEEIAARERGALARAVAGRPSGHREVLVRDVRDALRIARDDKRIKAVYLELDHLSPAGMSKLRDVANSLAQFRSSGKPVIAYGEAVLQSSYYLAAQADSVYLHPRGVLIIRGLGRWAPHYKEGLDRLGVELHVFRVGEYKSAVEPYLRDDMSKEAKEATLDVYGELWRTWVADVAKARGLRPEDVSGFVLEMPAHLKAAGGDAAKAVLAAHLVDFVAPRDEVEKRLITVAGRDRDGQSFSRVGLGSYLSHVSGKRARGGRGGAVGVVVARGEILDGRQPPGRVGGESTADLIRRVRQDPSLKALVLRIDSPGGSTFASEVIRHECELTRQSGKPVVVSMGSVAASGGYWISTASDEIWASPQTITGSIGIYGVLASVEKPLAKYLGIHVDGVGTTWLSGALRPDRHMDPAALDMVRMYVERGYEDFLERVGTARNMKRDEVDKLARGRIWSGRRAKELGLVDRLGDLDAAIAAAAERARLGAAYRVRYVEQPRSLRDRVLDRLGAWANDEREGGAEPRRASPAEEVLTELWDAADRLSVWSDPRGVYAHCLCGEEWP